MARNHLVKWMVGAASVLAFTGFMGMAKEYDETKQAVKGTMKDEAKQTAKDPVRDEFFGLDSSQTYKDYIDEDDYKKSKEKRKHHFEDDFDDDEYFKKEYYEPRKKYRTRAS